MTTILREWSESAGFDTPVPDEDGNVVLELEDGDVLVCQRGDTVVLTAPAGTLAESDDPDGLLADLLEANFLWRQSMGFTFALEDDGDRILLQIARPVAWFGSGEGFADCLANLTEARRLVRGLLGSDIGEEG